MLVFRQMEDTKFMHIHWKFRFDWLIVCQKVGLWYKIIPLMLFSFWTAAILNVSDKYAGNVETWKIDICAIFHHSSSKTVIMDIIDRST